MAKAGKSSRLTRTEARAARRARKQRRRRLLRWAAFTAVGIVATLLIVSLILPGLNLNFTSGGSEGSQGERVPIQGTAHIGVGQSHPSYNSTPPTSGWHYESPAPWGIYTSPLVDEIQVHNLEHGGIIVQYNCPDGCEELVQQLTDIVNRYQSHVILAPYANMDTSIALTAWGWIDKLEDFDEERIADFINGHIDRGPERVP